MKLYSNDFKKWIWEEFTDEVRVDNPFAYIIEIPIEVTFYFTPSEPQTYWEPGCPPEVELYDWKLFGQPATDHQEERFDKDLFDTIEERIFEEFEGDLNYER